MTSIMASRKRSASTGDGQPTVPKKRSMLHSRIESLGNQNSDARKSAEKLKRSVFCPHCGCYLSPKTFRKHKALYYNKDKDIWVGAEAVPKAATVGTYVCMCILIMCSYA